MNRRHLLALAPAVLVVLAACGPREGSDRGDPTIARETAQEAPSASASGDPSATDSEAPGQGPTPEEVETDPGSIHASEAQIADARAAVVATMEIWVQGSTMSQAEWEEALNATLTEDGAQRVSSSIWGYRILATAIEGEPEVLRADPSSATFEVATNAARYEVTAVLTDIDGEQQWRVSAINEIEE